jgi:hypothetical protein
MRNQIGWLFGLKIYYPGFALHVPAAKGSISIELRSRSRRRGGGSLQAGCQGEQPVVKRGGCKGISIIVCY